MKIGVYADPHFSRNSSILTGRMDDFSKRLFYLVKSFEWMNNFFKENQCKEVICLGDLTDRPDLTAEEITAISKCHLEDHYFLVGNHCRSNKDGSFNAISMFKKVYSLPSIIVKDGCRILLLPYSKEVIDLKQFENIDIILSHNDIHNYDFGNYLSQQGYELSDISENCKLFVNGHLHNGGWVVENKIVNLGQISGINFSSCGGQWEPSVGIIDTADCSLQIYENPFALRFKKVSFNTLSKIKQYLDKLPSMGYYVLQVKVPEEISQSARLMLNKSNRVIASRIIISRSLKKEPKPVDCSLIQNKSIYEKLKMFLSLQDEKKFDKDIAYKILEKIESE